MNLNYTIQCYSLKHLGVSCMNYLEYDIYIYQCAMFYHLKQYLYHGTNIVCFCKTFRTGLSPSGVFPTTTPQDQSRYWAAQGLHVYSTPPEAKKIRWRWGKMNESGDGQISAAISLEHHAIPSVFTQLPMALICISLFSLECCFAASAASASIATV